MSLAVDCCELCDLSQSGTDSDSYADVDIQISQKLNFNGLTNLPLANINIGSFACGPLDACINAYCCLMAGV